MDSTPEVLRERHQQWCAQVRAQPAQAEALTREALQGCRYALEAIVGELQAMDYPVPHMLLPPGNIYADVAELERVSGRRVPRALVLFWDLVGGVELVTLGGYEHLDFWAEHGLGDDGDEYCDGLCVGPIDAGTAEYLREELEGWGGAPEPPCLSLSPDALHKDDVSGGPAQGLELLPPDAPLGEADWICPWVGEAGGDFIGMLRESVLLHGGFPGFADAPAFAPIRQCLLRQVQPF